ncbi:MAG: universal stress protein [Dehalococcoidia bacterium]
MKALLTLDGSQNSESILPTARRLCELIPDLELHMLTVLDPKSVHGTRSEPVDDPKGAAAGTMSIRIPSPRVVETPGEAEERMQRETTASMGAIAREWFTGETPQYHVEWSRDPANTIVSCADKLDVDVIVMATHGRSGLSHLLAGSVAEAVIRRSKRPVLVQCPAQS